MRRRRLRDLSEVLSRVEALRTAAPDDGDWSGEALGTLRWALGLREQLPAYDEPFDHAAERGADVTAAAQLRPYDEVDAARRAAKLWHWRARTALLHAEGRLPLPEKWASVEQLVAATAMRGHEEGLLPPPLRGDLPAFGRAYRQLDADERALALSIAAERHYALNWLLDGADWDEVTTDT
jgi:hypothetical protein